MNMRSINATKLLILLSFIAALLVGFLLPMTTDEAYYIDWATRSSWPALGFFDHPPFVSWLATGTRVWHDIWPARLVVWISLLITTFFTYKTAKILYPERALMATAIIVTSIGGIASGVLLTPDTGLVMMWSVALHEAVLAVRGSRHRWLTAGLATGVGLLSKYTMVLIGPVFLWGMLRDNRKQLRTPWPYLGGLLCLLVFLPHLWWQSQNNWITFRFQFGHGFSIKQSLGFASTLPEATIPPPDSKNFKIRDDLFSSMGSVSGFAEAIRKPKPEKSKIDRAIQYSGDFLGGVAGLWGVYAVTALLFGVKTILHRRRNQSFHSLNPYTSGEALIKAAAFFPLLFFGVLSPFTKIEANWPAMHMAALAIFAAGRWTIPIRYISIAFGVHLAAITGLIFILIFPESVPFARNNRLLLESKGFRALGAWVEAEFPDKMLAVDSYQLKSAIRYYAPNTPVVQWPGITRGSEYTRGAPDDVSLEQKIIHQKNLTVISSDPLPYEIQGFSIDSFSGIRVCPDGRIGIFSTQSPILPCEKGLREWWMTTYK